MHNCTICLFGGAELVFRFGKSLLNAIRRIIHRIALHARGSNEPALTFRPMPTNLEAYRQDSEVRAARIPSRILITL